LAKTILITVEGDIPETELGKTATITIETRNYSGIVRAIVIHEEEPTVTSVTLEARSLKVKTA